MSTTDPGATYLDAFRRSVAQPAGTRERNLAAIERRLADGELADDDPPPRPVAGRWAAAVLVMKSVSLSLVLGTAGLGAIKLGVIGWSAATRADPVERPAPAADEGVGDERPAAPPRPAEAAAPAAQEEAAPVPDAPSDPMPVTVTAPVATTAAPDAKPVRRKTEPTAPDASIQDRLREEVKLMQRARTALEARRYAELLDVLADHRRRFPKGAMLEERQAWRAIAACELGRTDGPSQAKTFILRHPRSSLTSKVNRACSDAPKNKVTDSAASRDAGSR